MADRARRVARVAAWSAFLLFLVWLAWQVPPGAGAGEQRARTAAAALIERELAETGSIEDWPMVAEAGRAELLAAPLKPDGLVLLALAAEGEGRKEAAARLMQLAAERSGRDGRAHLWLFDHYLSAGAYAAALRHADAVLRTRSGLRSPVFETLIPLAGTRAGQAVIAEALAENPPWRGSFLRALARQAEDPRTVTALLAALKTLGSPPRNAELGTLLDRLIAAERYELAYLAWRRFAATAQHGAYLHNKDFEQPVSGLAFGWTFRRVPNADIDIIPGDDRKRLRLRFATGRSDGAFVRTMLFLPAGRYRFSGAAEAQALDTSRGLGWRLSCVGTDAELMTTAPLKGTVGRHHFTQDFTVPADCRAQRLRLELAARVAREREVSGGAAWYDSLNVIRLPTSGES